MHQQKWNDCAKDRLAKRRCNIREIPGLLETIHQHDPRTSVRVRRPPRRHQNCKTSHLISEPWRSTGTFHSIPRWPKNSRVWLGRDREDARRKHHWIGTDWMVSLIVFVSKNDRPMQFCVHCRKLYAISKCKSYPIPPMNKCIGSLGEGTVFYLLDTNGGY